MPSGQLRGHVGSFHEQFPGVMPSVRIVQLEYIDVLALSGGSTGSTVLLIGHNAFVYQRHVPTPAAVVWNLVNYIFHQHYYD